MATSKRQFTLRVEPQTFEKIKFISAQEKRSIAMQIELLIEKKIGEFEHEFGTIPVSQENL
jgi:hypothetical protein